MKRHEAFPGRFLKTADLGGKPALFTIARSGREPINDNEEKFVVHFAEDERGYVMNNTNWDVLEALFGEDSDDWVGQKIVLYPSTTPFQGKNVPCIRFRAPKSAPITGPKKVLQPMVESEDPSAGIDDEIPF